METNWNIDDASYRSPEEKEADQIACERNIDQRPEGEMSITPLFEVLTAAQLAAWGRELIALSSANVPGQEFPPASGMGDAGNQSQKPTK